VSGQGTAHSTPNIPNSMANVSHLDCTSAPLGRCRTQLMQVLTVATLVARSTNEAMVAPMAGSSFGWSMESGGRYRVDAFNRNLVFIRTEDGFTFTFLFTEILQILYFRYVLQIQCSNKVYYCSTHTHTHTHTHTDSIP
jgi:hypothetical protein